LTPAGVRLDCFLMMLPSNIFCVLFSAHHQKSINQLYQLKIDDCTNKTENSNNAWNKGNMEKRNFNNKLAEQLLEE